MIRLAWAAVAALSLAASPVLAQANENPWKGGAYWEVTGIHLEDGAGLTYAQHLAGQWRESQEYAKSRGWIRDYHVLTNEFPRDGEPDVYLIVKFDRFATPEEGEKRGAEYRAHVKTTQSQMAEASGKRASYRKVGSTTLLQEQVIR
jgi:hypothetical protein